ncbi:beta-lactamase domain protein (plasmid) [Gemmatirosa kalamazoonensis]|uniref:Beta-lactamase domain protein n=1 Tax=Gemmatirosa kalamazoonensis TaxID=861299 RepID=W0RN88_9BACT|nr:hypothetical protein [Gemmatirosa kalamazoonensis]AHG92499.1 beta-lactamase domain protein [Gemmatirosa kalamazoonensis]
MTHYICATCGTQHAASDAPPPRCAVCDDERQWVPASGQRWTTLDALRRAHRNAFRQEEPALLGIGTEPSFAIGQRALLVRTPEGNVLWDCVALLDDATVDIVRALGGIAAIAISHPHYYTTMVEWAHAFDCPVLLHAADRQWVMRPDERLAFWDGDTRALAGGLTLIRAGGHFAGGTVLHWPEGAGGRGALLSGDIVQVAPDGRTVSFMRSYPNMIPLAPATVRRIVERLAPYRYERVIGAWWDRTIDRGGDAAVRASAERYARWATTPTDE